MSRTKQLKQKLSDRLTDMLIDDIMDESSVENILEEADLADEDEMEFLCREFDVEI